MSVETDPGLDTDPAENRIAAGIAERLQQAIPRGDLAEVSRRSGVPYPSLRKYLDGRQMRPSALIALSKAIPVRLEWLLTGEGAMRPEPPPGAIGSTLPGGVAIAAGPVMPFDAALQEAPAGYNPIPGPPDEWDVASLTMALDTVERRTGAEAPAAQRIGLALDHARLFRKAERMPQLREFDDAQLAACLGVAEQLLPAFGRALTTVERVTAMLQVYMVMRGAKG